MGWYRDLKTVLAGEPETWLAYLHGQQMDNLPLLSAKKPRYRGFVLQVAKFGALLLRDCRLKQPKALKRPAKFFVFAGTANQMNSLDQTIESLQQKGETVISVGNPHLVSNNGNGNDYVSFQLAFVDVLRALLLFATRGLQLYRVLKDNHPVSVGWHFSNFCRVYIYLVYFYRVLLQVNPSFVITANDHNAPNRCMLAIAHQLGIKTIYLQHASVSPVFPALRVNYAFLDGQCAFDTYLQCEPNQPETVRSVPIPEVILSGQKKHLRRSDTPNKKVVGVALNALDDSKAGIEFISALAENGQSVRLRWHPGQAPRDTEQYRQAFSKSQQVSLSDPRQESVAEFMEQIGWLIAGNSSIHLEAALAGVMPIYYELMPADHPDYYGYVKHGLSQAATSVTAVLGLINNTSNSTKPNPKAVRYYSTTYLTEWEGREGELVAACLQALFEGKKMPVENQKLILSAADSVEAVREESSSLLP